MYFHVYSFKLQIHAHIYRSFIRHHKMLGVRIAKRKNEPQKPANPCGTKLRARIFFGTGKFASQTYPAGELKSRGNPAKVNDPTQFEQVDETCEFGGAVLYSESLDMTAFLGIDAPRKI